MYTSTVTHEQDKQERGSQLQNPFHFAKNLQQNAVHLPGFINGAQA